MRTVDVGGLAVGDGHPPRIMGVLNVSPESPYEPSVFADPAAAATYVEEMIRDGADIVDVGLESANKRFSVRDVEWELDRLELALDTIERVDGSAVFSIETRYSEVAARALDAGFDMVNDICGFADPAMPDVCADRDAAVVKMAGPGDLTRPGAIEAVDDIYAALADGRLTEKTIVDPAFGGWSEEKTLADDRETFRRLREFQGLGRPILVSIHRKNFLREIVGRSTEAALPASLAATAMAVTRGADVVRTHDVAETRDAAMIGHSFASELTREDRIVELDVTSIGEARRHFDRLGLDAAGAGPAVARSFELRDFAAPERTRVREVAVDAGAAVEWSGDRGILAGSVRSLDRVASILESELADVAAGVREAIDR